MNQNLNYDGLKIDDCNCALCTDLKKARALANEYQRPLTLTMTIPPSPKTPEVKNNE